MATESLSEILRFKNSQHNNVLIDLPNVGLVKANYTEGFTFGFGNQFFEPFADAANAISGALQTSTKLVAGAGVTAADASNTYRTFAQSGYSYSSSERFKLTMNVSFKALEPDDDVRQMIRPLIIASNAERRGGMIHAPLGYAHVVTAAFNTIAVRIGRWFNSSPCLVLTSFQPSFSKSLTKRGLPLYCDAQIEFEAYRLLDAIEVANMFTNDVVQNLVGEAGALDDIRRLGDEAARVTGLRNREGGGS